MATNVVWLKIEGARVAPALEDARAKLDGAPEEVVLDFSLVRRIDPAALQVMESIADRVDGQGTKVVLRGVSVDIYKVLKLTKLAPRFLFRH